MIDDATIKLVARERGIIIPDDPFTATCLTKEQFNELSRAIEQLARQEQRETDAMICESIRVDVEGNHPYTGFKVQGQCAEAIRASGKENKIDHI